MLFICLTRLCAVVLPFWLLVLAVPAFAQTSDPGSVVCVPDATGEGWACQPDTGEVVVPTIKRPVRAPKSSSQPLMPQPVVQADVEVDVEIDANVDTNIDPLTGLSTDPSDWFAPTAARPVADTHRVEGDLAQRIYSKAKEPGVEPAVSDGMCEGGYVLRDYPLPETTNSNEYPLVAEADSLSTVLDESADLIGNVTIEQGNRRLLAPSARMDLGTRIATFEAGMVLDQPGLVMQGEHAEVNTMTKDAALEGVQFVLVEPRIRGEADAMQQQGNGDLQFSANQFTRCPPDNNGWRLNTKQLVIKDGEVFGTAKHAVLRMKNVPVFYTPYLKFPVSDERLSGFLFPTFSHSDEDGVDISIPYYLNLAPNYDATIIPRVIGERGVGAETEFRHKSSWQETSLSMGYLPEDKLFNGVLDRKDWREQGGAAVFGEFEPADRWLGAVNHEGYFGKGFRTLIDYTAASDREYFRDLGSDLGLSSRRELERKGEIRYSQGGLSARLWAQRFQRLDEVFTEDYERLPELELSYGRQVAGPLEVNLGFKWSEFDRQTEGLNGLAAVTGRRVHLEPRVQLPFSWPYAFLTLGGGYRYTSYELEQDRNAAGYQLVDDNPDRNIGLGHVDGGLFFERPLRWFNQDLVQTLEPRMYYLWQEYDEQVNLPRFDVSDLTFGYSQLFRDNRFSGLDRIGDANQLSAGLTTRFVSSNTGKEFFRASVGEIYYFEDRRVTLTGNPGIDEQQSSSAFAGEIAASLGGSWRVFGNVVWDPHDNEVDEGGGGIGYQRDNRHIINVGFRNRRREDIEQTDISLYWPLSKRFAVMGRWNYDLVSGRTIEGFGGLEYSDCCLQVRLLARRFLDSRSNDFSKVEADEGIFLQIIFKGLAGFGTKVESVLERGVRGYRSAQPQDYFSN